MVGYKKNSHVMYDIFTKSETFYLHSHYILQLYKIMESSPSYFLNFD